ncbi:MAG: hypothetical protein JWP61_2682 [Friedmanniella sp.]|nr:hypothetical protein [Friedmanniella sp.]
MSSRPLRIAAAVLGVLVLLTGLVWVGQGLNYIPGSFMTGNKTWFWIGLVAVLVGLGLLIGGLRRPPRSR